MIPESVLKNEERQMEELNKAVADKLNQPDTTAKAREILMKILIEHVPEDYEADRVSVTIYAKPSGMGDANKIKAWIKQFDPDKVVLPFRLNMDLGK